MASTTVNFSLELSAYRYQEYYQNTRSTTESSRSVLAEGVRTRDHVPELSFRSRPGSSQDILSLGNRTYTSINDNTVYRVIEERVNVKIEGSFTVEDGERPSEVLEDKLSEYFSPGRTADRIVKFATGFFDAFAKQGGNTDSPDENTISDFESLVRDAIDQGFSEARDILDGVFGDQGLPERFSKMVDETYKYVQDGLDKFFEQLREGLLEPSESTEIRPEIEEGVQDTITYQLASNQVS